MIDGAVVAEEVNLMPGWVVWVVLAGVLGVAEVLTLGLVLGLTAIAALVAAAMAAAGASLPVQLVAFIASALALLLLVRPVARRHVRTPARLQTGAAALEGRTAVAVTRVDATSGLVKINGEIWSARAFDGRSVIEPGAHVDVLKIEGVTALVHESEKSWLS